MGTGKLVSFVCADEKKKKKKTVARNGMNEWEGLFNPFRFGLHLIRMCSSGIPVVVGSLNECHVLTLLLHPLASSGRAINYGHIQVVTIII